MRVFQVAVFQVAVFQVAVFQLPGPTLTHTKRTDYTVTTSKEKQEGDPQPILEGLVQSVQ